MLRDYLDQRWHHHDVRAYCHACSRIRWARRRLWIPHWKERKHAQRKAFRFCGGRTVFVWENHFFPFRLLSPKTLWKNSLCWPGQPGPSVSVFKTKIWNVNIQSAFSWSHILQDCQLFTDKSFKLQLSQSTWQCCRNSQFPQRCTAAW